METRCLAVSATLDSPYVSFHLFLLRRVLPSLHVPSNRRFSTFQELIKFAVRRTRLATPYPQHTTTNRNTTTRPNESKRWSHSSSEFEERESPAEESSTSGDDRLSRNDGSDEVDRSWGIAGMDSRYEKLYFVQESVAGRREFT